MKIILYTILLFLLITTILGLINFFNPRNCSDFYGSHSIAQVSYEKNPKKYYNLDRDKDGIACEHLISNR